MFTENEIKILIAVAVDKNIFFDESSTTHHDIFIKKYCLKPDTQIPLNTNQHQYICDVLKLDWQDVQFTLHFDISKTREFLSGYPVDEYCDKPRRGIGSWLLGEDFGKFCFMSYKKKDNMENSKQSFVESFEAFSKEMYDNNVNKGFWPENRNIGEALALVHSEISEALEGLRQGNPADDKIPQHSCMAAELADAIIRIMDISQGLKLNVGQAIVDKHNFNLTRPHKHGKKF